MITRAEANARGLKRYFNGNPCKHGHVGERRTSTGLCVECSRYLARGYARADRADPVKYARRLLLSRTWKANLPSEHKRRLDDKKLEWQRQYFALPENRAKRARRKYQEDPARDIARVHKRRFLKEKNGGEYTSEDVGTLHKVQGGRCAYCRVKFGK